MVYVYRKLQHFRHNFYNSHQTPRLLPFIISHSLYLVTKNSTDVNSHLLLKGVMLLFRVMDKAIERYLARRGIHKTVKPASERSFTERAPDFFGWFHQSVLGLDTEEYRREFWREAYRTGHTIGHVPHTLDDYLFRRRAAFSQEMFGIFMYALFMGSSFAVWVMRRQIDKHIRRLKRPGYYEAELARRKQMAEERRKLRRRRTLDPCPTPDALMKAFAKAKESPADMIRFGSLLEDLECYVDNSIMFDEFGNVAGRKGGIRQYLADNAPELFNRYKTVMRYKALSKKFRQALGAKDPMPASELLPDDLEKLAENSETRAGAVENAAVEQCKSEVEGAREFTSVVNLKGLRERARELLSGCEGTCVSLMAVLEMRLNPDYAPRTNLDRTAESNSHYTERMNGDSAFRKNTA